MKWAVEKEVKRIVKFSEKEVLKFSQKNKEKPRMIRLICYKSAFYRYFWSMHDYSCIFDIIFVTIKNKRKTYWFSQLEITKTYIRFWIDAKKVNKSHENNLGGDIHYMVFDYEVETKKICKKGRRYNKRRSPK